MAVHMKAEETKELTTQVGVRDQDLQVDQANDKQIMVIMGVLNSKLPFNVAEIIRKYCSKVLSALKELISEEVTTACQKLCRRSDGSVLYGNSYESLKEFTFDSVQKC